MLKSKENKELCRKHNAFAYFFNRLNSLRQYVLAKYSWRFLFVFFIIIILFGGLSPIRYFKNSIKALNEKNDIVNLYASSCYPEQVSDDFSEGWWTHENAQGKPQVSPVEDILAFSDSNSAFYSGGNFSLECGSFKPTIERIEPIEDVVEVIDEAEEAVDEIDETDENNNEPLIISNNKDVDTENDEATSSSDYEKSIGDASAVEEASSSVDEVDSTENKKEESSEVLEEKTDNNLLEEPISPPLETKEEESTILIDEEVSNVEEVEVIEDKTVEEVEVIEDNKESEESDVQVEEIDDVSLLNSVYKFGNNILNKSKKIFALYLGKMQAIAQTVASLDNSDLNSLGDYRSAKIKFSLALSKEGSYVLPDDVRNEISNQVNDSEVLPEEEQGALENGDEFLPEGEIVGEDLEGDGTIINEEDLNNGEEVIDEENIETQSEESSEQINNEENNSIEENNSEEDGEIYIESDNPVEEIINTPDESSNELDEKIIIDPDETQVEVIDEVSKIFGINKANAQIDENADLVIWYSLGEYNQVSSTTASTTKKERIWSILDVINGDDISNAINGDYFSYDAPFLKSWEDIKNLKIKFEGRVNDESVFVTYVDGVWVEAMYKPSNELEMIKKRERWENALKLLSDQTVFKVEESGEFTFRYLKNSETLLAGLGEMIGLTDYWSNIDMNVELINNNGKLVDIPISIVFGDEGVLSISLSQDGRELKPGKYKLKFSITDNSGEEAESFELYQDFSWGVLALNANKSMYLPEEQAYLQMAVLDDNGHTICDARLEVEIESPSGQVDFFYTDEDNSTSSNYILNYQNTIIKNSECGADNYLDSPDYYFYYNLFEIGEYLIKVKAITDNGVREINDYIEVKESLPYEIERIGPTRINPKYEYEMIMRIKANEAYSGDIIETIPSGYKLVNHSEKVISNPGKDIYGNTYYFDTEDDGDEKKIMWQGVEMDAGDVIEISYTFDAPDTSPEFYLLGPLKMDNFQEARKWQVASDALNTRAKTVKFLLGNFSGDGTTGINTNTNYVFSGIDFKLAESGVDIKSAFVVFDTQFEAYGNNSGNYTGYNMYFDSCSGASCTINALGGSGRVLKSDPTVLAYDEAESNFGRIVFDVTSETQLGSYTGGSSPMKAQLAFNLSFGSTINSIAKAHAVLYLTYTHDADSENLTNTVVYPLDSNTGTDNGSSQTSVNASCTKNTDCPLYNYNMDIPDFPGVATTTNRLSQWFLIHNAPDSGGATDKIMNVNIQGDDTDSSNFVHEQANGGVQSYSSNIIFNSVSGYSENSSQQLEFYADTDTNYMVGGEVYETYMSSSSEPVKTRTVSFPIGVINDGQTTAQTSGSVDVYFPENGTATGTVNVKSAWLRITSNNYNSGNMDVDVSTDVAANPTSGVLTYAYNGGNTVVSSFKIIHIIPSSDYAELEEANSTTGKTVTVYTQNNNTNAGGLSAELVITYTYTDEGSGYLTSLQTFAGQTDTAASDQSENETTANSVMPEEAGKTVRAAALWASFLHSSTDSTVPGAWGSIDANLAVSSPTCTNAYGIRYDAANTYVDMYKDVTSAMNTTDNQSYTACYTNDGSGDANVGAKMNGILDYTYSWDNSPPTGAFNSVQQKLNGTGIVDLSIEVNDPDKQNSRAKIEYATGTSCVFSPSGDPTLDESDVNISADFGDPDIKNNSEYQVGQSGAYITTASGSNSVLFDWDTKTDLPAADGDYCLQLTVNDLLTDQVTLATTTLTIDNVIPTQPGALSLNSRTGTEVVLNFGATSTETNFKEYKIYYKQYDGTDPDEGDSVLASSTNVNLGNILFNSVATTSISSLIAKTQYSFAIWVYDDYGNAASSSRVDITTNDAPTAIFNSAIQETVDGTGKVDISIEVDDNNNDDTLRAKIEYVASSSCDFSVPLDPDLDETQSNIYADFGVPKIYNNQEYQVGSSSGWILTSPGANTIEFDWDSAADEPSADKDYCLRLTVNDGLDDQLLSTTTILTLDNIDPTAPGSLSFGSVTTDSVELIFASTSPSVDTNEPVIDSYKIFYTEGTFGVTESDTEKDDVNLNSYDYNGATSTIVTGLNSNIDYVFNIWAYDTFGHAVSAGEVTIKTNAPIANNSLTFVNPVTLGTTTNILLADDVTEYTFRAQVTEINGFTAIASTTLKLADSSDNTSPYDDLVFYWDQASDSFYAIGSDALSAVTLSGNSTSTCAVNTCTLDFVLVVDDTFQDESIDYNATLRSGNDSGVVDFDTYDDIYQVRATRVEQIHYRWRNDDGGE